MTECPRCKGEKESKMVISREYEPVRYEASPCRLCAGAGEITGMRLAIYKAQGGLPPVPLKGYA